MRCFILFLLFVSTSYGQDEWVGRRFMDRQGTAVIRDGRQVNWHQVSFPLVVKEMKGEWLDVGPGQIRKADAIPIDDAAVYYTEFLSRNPRSSWGYNRRGIVWREMGEIDRALKDFGEAIRLDPKNAWAYKNRGNLLRKEGNFDAALEDYNEAIRIDPIYATAYYGRGLVRHEQANFDAALLDFTEAIRLDPKLAWSFNGRGVTWKAQGDLDAALRDYGEAIRLDPKYAIAYSNRAWVRATSRDKKYRNGKQAVEDATRACELTNWSDTAKLRTLAAAFAESGDFNKAIEWQTKAMELAPADKQSGYRSRLNLYRSGKPYREDAEASPKRE